MIRIAFFERADENEICFLALYSNSPTFLEYIVSLGAGVRSGAIRPLTRLSAASGGALSADGSADHVSAGCVVVPSLFLFVPPDPDVSHEERHFGNEFAEDFPHDCFCNARTIAPIIVASINRAAARIQKPIYSGSAGRNHPMGMPAGAPHSGQNWASGGNSAKQLEQPPFSGRVGSPQ